MPFVDEARIWVKAGDGGKGCESFYRDKYMRYPRPDGGDGGNGGDVILQADRAMHTLLDYRFKQHYRAGRGGHASSKGKRGRDGTDCILRVPMGTVIRDEDTGLLIRDLVHHDQSVMVVKGGLGGRGNKGNRTPTPPEPGQQRAIRLELKLIADVGIVGFPNAGKSTLISAISQVRSKVGHYPFTTRQPILGVVFRDDQTFTIADLPGLIEGAHSGKGLGDRFLKHAERTRILVHLIDMAGQEGRDPSQDFRIIEQELAQYSDQLSLKRRVIVANKMDLSGADENLKRFRCQCRQDVLEISALHKTHVTELVEHLTQLLTDMEAEQESA